MDRGLSRIDFRMLVPKKEYKSEGEFEVEVKAKLADFFKVKQSQIKDQFVTTSFEGTNSNRADIVVVSDEEMPHALIVIELKLDRHIKKYHGGSYKDGARQLNKYCQDIRAPYGVLLTENYCLIYEFDYYDLKPRESEATEIPYPKDIEIKLTKRSIIEFVTHKDSLRYIYYFVGGLLLFFLIELGLYIYGKGLILNMLKIR